MTYIFSFHHLFIKPHGLGKKYYPMRTVGYLFAVFTMAAQAYDSIQSKYFYLAMVWLFLVPHFNYVMYRLSNSHLKVELSFLLLDTFWSGIFIMFMNFAPFPSLMIVLMTCSGNLGVKGIKQFVIGLFCIVLGIFVVRIIKPFEFHGESSLVVLIISAFCLASYTLSFVYLAYRSAIYQKKLRKQIEEEKQRSEDLLLNILPEQTALELKQKGSVDVQKYEMATVMFTDFKDFTKMSEKIAPEKLILHIDKIFKAFDEITAKHKLEKIKTIGDAYMCAGGLPQKNSTHATDVIAASLDILSFIENYKIEQQQQGLPIFEIRIGIHTGPLVAGVVGIKKFSYDIWGDTVNIASRMESSGEVGKVNISSSTYHLIKHVYPCSYRGKLVAKNKGEIDMYFID
jgi:class 3 adenylate cyclase